MPKTADEAVDFDVLLRSPASGKEPDVSTIDRFRPSPEDIERCRRWFAAQGVKAYATDFGLACKASRTLIEALLHVILKPTKAGPGRPPFEIVGQPVFPKEIGAIVEQVTITAAPELF